MKWIKKFENIEEEDGINDRFGDLDQFNEYFQELVDDWDIKIEYDDESYSDVYADILAIKIKIGDDLWDKFPSFVRTHKAISTIQWYYSFNEYFKFMSDLKKCIDHLISSSEGNYECTKIIQGEYLELTIMIE